MFSFDAKVGLRRHAFVAVVVGSLLAMSSAHAAEGKPQATDAKKLSVPAQKRYASPEDAVKDLIAAAKAGDTKAMTGILGPEAKVILQSGDAVGDKEARERFVKSYEEASKLDKTPDKAVLNTGKDAWPFPIPIIKDGAEWRFDTTAGKDELLNRRIGRNEISAMQAVLAYVDAQREYYLANPQKDKLLSYAQRFASTQGRRDGLYFPTKAGERSSPLGPLFDAAKSAGYAKGEGGKPAAYYGYHFRILKAQGGDAPGGAYDYVAQGRMIGGHALIAWPATYGNSGVMTFIVNHDGVVYEKDLGPDTANVVAKISRFNPDKSWKQAETR